MPLREGGTSSFGDKHMHKPPPPAHAEQHATPTFLPISISLHKKQTTMMTQQPQPRNDATTQRRNQTATTQHHSNNTDTPLPYRLFCNNGSKLHCSQRKVGDDFMILP